MAQVTLFAFPAFSNGDQFDVYTIVYNIELNAITFLSLNEPDVSQIPQSIFSEYERCGIFGMPETNGNLYRFRTIDTAPYAEIVEIENSPACAIAFCDLIASSVSVVPESAAGQADGEATITATSTGGTIEYSLDGTNWQTGNVFAGLSEGDYIAFVRDANGCTNQRAFTVPLGLPIYGLRYEKDCGNRCGQVVTLQLYQAGYTGEVDSVLLGVSGITLDWNSRGDELYTALKPRTCNIQLTATQEGQYTELYAERWTDWRVDVLLDSVLEFRGYIVPGTYREAYIRPPYYVDITATCGLANLQTLPYAALDGSKYTGRVSLLEVLKNCMSKLGALLPFSEQPAIYAAGMDSGNGDPGPLAQAYIDNSLFEGMDCRAAVAALPIPSGLRIFQYAGQWWATVWDSDADTVTLKHYDAGTWDFDNTDTLARVQQVGYTGKKWLQSGATLEMLTPAEAVSVDYDASPDNLIVRGFQDSDFSTDTVLADWTGSAPIEKGLDTDGGAILEIIGANFGDVGSRELERVAPFSYDISGQVGLIRLSLEFQYQPVGGNLGLFITADHFLFSLQIGSRHLHCTWTSQGVTATFETTPKINEYLIFEGEQNKWTALEITATYGGPDTAGPAVFTLYQPSPNRTMPDKTLIRDLAVEWLPENTQPISSRKWNVRNDARKYLDRPEAIKAVIGDAPAQNNALNIYTGGLTLQDGSLTSQWGAGNLPILNVLTRRVAAQYFGPRQLLTGGVEVKLTPLNLLQDAGQPTKRFVIVSCSVDILLCFSQVEAVELIEAVPGTVALLDTVQSRERSRVRSIAQGVVSESIDAGLWLKPPVEFNAAAAGGNFPAGDIGDHYEVIAPGTLNGIFLRAGDVFYTGKTDFGAGEPDKWVVIRNVVSTPDGVAGNFLSDDPGTGKIDLGGKGYKPALLDVTEELIEFMHRAPDFIPAFNVGAGFNAVARAVVKVSGQYLVGGGFNEYNNTAVPARLTSLDTSGDIGTLFSLYPYTGNVSVLYAGASQIYASVAGALAGNLTAHNEDGVLLWGRGFLSLSLLVGSTGFPGSVTAIAETATGGIYVGGGFNAIDSDVDFPHDLNNIVRLNPDGSEDTDFDVRSGNGFAGTVRSIELDGDDLYVGGAFTAWKGTPANRIVKLDEFGDIVPAFDYGAGFDNTVFVVRKTSGGIYVGGNFRNYDGSTAEKIIKLDDDGSIDTAFDPQGGFMPNSGFGTGNIVVDIQEDASGNVYVCGNFTSYQGRPANRIIKLASNGDVDETFYENMGVGLNATANKMHLDSERLVVVGSFQTYNGFSSNRIAVLSLDGVLLNEQIETEAKLSSFAAKNEPLYIENATMSDFICEGNKASYITKCFLLSFLTSIGIDPAGPGDDEEIDGDDTETDFPIPHDLDTTDLIIQVFSLNDGQTIDGLTIVTTDSDTVTVSFGVPPGVGDAFKVLMKPGQYATDLIGDGTAALFGVNHFLNNQNVFVSLYDKSDNSLVPEDGYALIRTNANVCLVVFETPPPNAYEFRAVVGSFPIADVTSVIGDGVTVDFPIYHSQGTTDVIMQAYRVDNGLAEVVGTRRDTATEAALFTDTPLPLGLEMRVLTIKV